MFVSSAFELSGRVNHWFAQVSIFPHLADMLRTPSTASHAVGLYRDMLREI
jgi:hypothetical protein